MARNRDKGAGGGGSCGGMPSRLSIRAYCAQHESRKPPSTGGGGNWPGGMRFLPPLPNPVAAFVPVEIHSPPVECVEGMAIELRGGCVS